MINGAWLHCSWVNSQHKKQQRAASCKPAAHPHKGMTPLFMGKFSAQEAPKSCFM